MCFILVKMEVYIVVHIKDYFFIIDKFDPNHLYFMDLKAHVCGGQWVDYKKKVPGPTPLLLWLKMVYYGLEDYSIRIFQCMLREGLG